MQARLAGLAKSCSKQPHGPALLRPRATQLTCRCSHPCRRCTRWQSRRPQPAPTRCRCAPPASARSAAGPGPTAGWYGLLSPSAAAVPQHPAAAPCEVWTGRWHARDVECSCADPCRSALKSGWVGWPRSASIGRVLLLHAWQAPARLMLSLCPLSCITVCPLRTSIRLTKACAG